MQAIDPEVGITGTTGGAYSHDYKPNSDDYVIVSSINATSVPQIIEAAKKYGVEQIDIHKSTASHRPGDFYFHNTTSGTATEYYEKYGKQFEEAGLLTGLHTYAYYIDYNATNILSNPKWQKDLEVLEEYTLRKDISATSRNLPTEEDASGFDMTYSFFYKNSRYVLIDEEIILISTGGSTSGLLGCKRGQGGTTATTHKAGAKIKHLSGYFNLFVPKLGSELFYHVADLTAKAYNEGGFKMIYLDAIDGLSRHLPEGHETWYYFQKFLHRVVSQCEISPIIETSSGAPQEWNVRGRTGATDSPSRGYNNFNRGHITSNKTSMSYNLNTTLGWYGFYPDRTETYKNMRTRTQFHNNLDYLGYQAVLYNMSIVINGFTPSTIESSPFYQANLNYYKKYYSDLRKSEYFAKETLDKVKESEYEFKIIEKAQNEFAFLEVYYNYFGKVGASSGNGMSFKGNNPFKAQKPFIRIEQMFSTLAGSDSFTLASFDESLPLSEQSLKVNLSNVNLNTNQALKLRVKGTGADGDAMLISISGTDSGRGDYFIDLSFEGWRDIILAELDNGEYDTDKYKFGGVSNMGDYPTFVSSISFGAAKLLEIRLCGKTAGNASVGEILACVPCDAPVKNPTITVGNDTVTFNTTLKSGEYLEYDPLTDTATVYHAYNQTTETVTVSGAVPNVATGNFEATYSAEALNDAPVRAVVVTGFAGQEITN